MSAKNLKRLPIATGQTMVHVQWTNGTADPVAMCGGAASLLYLLEPHLVARRKPGATCLACLQMLCELRRHRDARLTGMPELWQAAAWLADTDLPF